MRNKKDGCRTKVILPWMLAGGLALLSLLIYFRDELYGKWLRSGGIEDVTYEGKSRLEDPGACYLCGGGKSSMTDYYHRFEGLGLISLNNWYVLDFRLKRRNESDVDVRDSFSCTYENDGKIVYALENSFYGAMASVEVILPEDYELKIETIEGYLCQPCLEKVIESLEFQKWKNEKKEAVPLCLVDFKTLELYSLQEDVGYAIRDYWIEIERDKNTISLDAYDLSA